MQILSPDLLAVQAEPEAAFRKESGLVRSIVRKIRDIVEGFYYEKTDDDCEYNFMTTAVRENMETFGNAGGSIWEASQEQGLYPQVTHEKVGVKCTWSECKRISH